MKKLYLNNKLVDIIDNSIAITKQVNDIAELRDSQSHYTNKFKLPFTPRNKEVLEGLGITGSRSRKAYQKIPATYIDDGEDMIPDGYAIINKFDGDNYYCTIYDGNIFFFEAIGDEKLSDIDLSELNHDLTTANFVNSFPNVDGMIYAISDYGNFNPNDIVINYQLPSFFVHYLWRRIWEDAGFDYHGDIFSEQRFKELVITAKRGYVSETDTGTASQIDPSGTSSADADGCPYPCYYDPVLPVKSLIQYPDTSNGVITLENSAITVAYTGAFTAEITIDNITSFGIPIVYLEEIIIFINGTAVSHINIGAIASLPLTVTSELNLNTGDVVSFQVYWADRSVGLTGYHYYGEFDLKFYNVAGATGIHVNVNTFIGETTKKEFIKDVMQHFGLMMQKRRYTNDYDFVQRNKLVIDKANAEDWTDKFNKVTNTDYAVKTYAQKNRFAYNYINEDGERNKDGFLEINNTTLPIEKTQVLRPYNACEISDLLLNDKLVTSTPFWEPKRDDAGNITKWKVIKGKNFFAKVVYNNEEINYKTASGSSVTFNGDVPRLSFEDLDYQTILDENYNNLKIVLDWNKIKSTEFLLTKYEVKNIDFLRLKKSKQLASYFILNKIKGYRRHLAKCEILLIPPFKSE